jgi:hypothetical protein
VNRLLLAALAGLGVVVALTGCGSSATLNPASASPASASPLASSASPAAVHGSGSSVCGPADLVARRMGMKRVTVYTATSDLNHLLGRQGEYTSKVEWTTSGEDSGIEVFPDAADARLRYNYLRAFRPPIGDGYDLLYHAAILRLASIYTPSQAEKLKASFLRSCGNPS